ncbi:hypothetical protein Vi05172_g11454 [Venturia inaequalis]|nr:hypothetical protein Vi05172_g11454 [Venturia inaequalis]
MPIYLPPELVGKILEHTVLSFGVWQALRLRTISKLWDQALIQSLSTTRALEDDELLYEQDSRYPWRKAIIPSVAISNIYIAARVFADGKRSNNLSRRLHLILENLGYDLGNDEAEYREAMRQLVSAVICCNYVCARYILQEKCCNAWSDQTFKRDELGARVILRRNVNMDEIIKFWNNELPILKWDRYWYNYHAGAFDESILYLAAIGGDEKIIEKILRHIPKQAPANSSTMQAVIDHGHESALSTLLQTGLDVDRWDLCYAAERGDPIMINHIIQVLKERVKFDEKSRWWDMSRIGTRNYRKEMNTGRLSHPDVFQGLVKSGNTSLVKEAIREAQTEGHKMPNYRSALREAVSRGHHGIVQTLLNCLAYSSSKRDSIDQGVLHALPAAASNGDLSTLSLLLDSIPSSIWATIGNLSNVLNAATLNGHAAVASRLLKLIEENIPSIEHRIYIGQRALLTAVRLGFESIAQLLIVDYGIPVNGYNPFRSCDIDRDNNADHSPMMIATLAGQPHIVKLLRSHGAPEIDIWAYGWKTVDRGWRWDDYENSYYGVPPRGPLQGIWRGPYINERGREYAEKWGWKSGYAIKYKKCLERGAFVIPWTSGGYKPEKVDLLHPHLRAMARAMELWTN